MVIPHHRYHTAVNKRGTVKDGQGIFYGWVILGVVFITLVLAYGVRNSFSVFYPTIVEEFDWGRGSTALMFSISIIVYGLAAPLAGSLVDRFKPRLILALGGIILGGGIALCSLANSQWQFYLLFGVISAIGLSLVGATPLNTIVSHWFVKRRGLAFGITSAGFGTSLISASIAQLLISSFDWRKAYIIIGIFAVAIITPLCGFLMHRSPQDKGLLPDGETKKSPPPQDPAKPQMREEGWAATGWTLSRAVKTYQFWLLFLIAFCSLGLAEQIAIAHQVYFFRDVGYEPMLAANIYSLFGLAFILGTLASLFSDRFGREKVFIPGCLLSAAAVCLLFLIRDASHPWMPILFAICFGLGLGPIGPVLFATAADLFQGRHFGSILGTIIIGFSLGGAIAPWLAGFLHDITNSYFPAFFIISGSLVATAVLMWFVAPSKIRPSSGQAQHPVDMI
jgi:sugar phosphate permease